MNDFHNQVHPAARHDEMHLEIAVQGMTCSGCSGRVQRALSQEPGVGEASVDLAKGIASITYDPARTDAAVLVGVVRKVGYQADVKDQAANSGGGI
jgi:copper chaperone CopZ